MNSYYEDEAVTLYHGDCLDVLPGLDPGDFAALVMDPPYGIDYRSNRTKLERVARSIRNDDTTAYRDAVLEWWGDRPAIVFGSPSAEPPANCRMNLVWHKPGSGMGDLSLPWKPDYEFIHVLGSGFSGRRDTAVLTFPLRVFRGSLSHPHEKPIDLMRALLAKCPEGPVLDPFAGSGTTLRAAKDVGRRAVGCEVDDRYVDLIVGRLAQEALPMGDLA